MIIKKTIPKHLAREIEMLYSVLLKRIFDVLLSALLLLILSPLLFIVSLLVVGTSKGPLFFLQKRVGKDLCEFNIYKFRTMTDRKHQVKRIIGKTDDITTVGYYLRRFKIDELPQLYNVLKGDMSLVGPRPSIKEQLVEMSEEEKRRYSVRPGMTGLAQVCGNIHISWNDRYKYDLEYVKNVSFVNDMKIILRTVLIIVMGEEKFIDKPLNINRTK